MTLRTDLPTRPKAATSELATAGLAGARSSRFAETSELATAGLAGARSSRFAETSELATAGLAGARSSRFAVPFARELAAHGDRVALITRDEAITYTNLASRVEALALRLGPQRRLVLLVGANTVDAIVIYLAALSAGHPVLLVPG